MNVDFNALKAKNEEWGAFVHFRLSPHHLVLFSMNSTKQSSLSYGVGHSSFDEKKGEKNNLIPKFYNYRNYLAFIPSIFTFTAVSLLLF